MDSVELHIEEKQDKGKKKSRCGRITNTAASASFTLQESLFSEIKNAQQRTLCGGRKLFTEAICCGRREALLMPSPWSKSSWS